LAFIESSQKKNWSTLRQQGGDVAKEKGVYNLASDGFVTNIIFKSQIKIISMAPV
jgi:hypothetical protein